MPAQITAEGREKKENRLGFFAPKKTDVELESLKPVAGKETKESPSTKKKM